MRRRHQSADDELENARDSSSRRGRRRRQRRRWGFRRYLIVTTLLAVLLIGFLPRLAALPMFRPLLLGVASNFVRGSVEADTLSLGWFAPIQATNLRLKDSQGNIFAQFGELRSEKSLLSLATLRNEIGVVHVDRPELQLVARAGGSNLEDFLAPVLEAPADNSASMPRVTVRWTNGTIRLSGPTTLRPAEWSEVSGHLVTGAVDTQIAFAGSAAMRGADGTVGNIQWDGEIVGVADGNKSPLQVSLVATDAPLESLAIAMARMGEPGECTGTMSGELRLTGSGDSTPLSAELVNVRVNRFAMTAPQRLGSDRLQIERLHAAGRLQWDGERLTADRLHCQTEFGLLDASGTWEPATLVQSLSAGQLPTHDFQVSGSADVARLTQMLPQTLQLQPGVLVQRGQLEFQSFCRMEGSRRRFLINAEARELAGVRDGQPIRWSQPVRLVAALAQSGSQTSLESVEFETSAVSLKGQSDVRRGSLEAKGDLGQLQTELDQFFSLGQFNVQGRFEGTASWTTESALVAQSSWPVQLDADMQLENVELRIPGWEPFAESGARVKLSASGEAQRNGSMRIATGQLDYEAGNDRLKAVLSQPLDNPGWNSTIVSDTTLTGDLAQWLRRLGPFLPRIDATASGTVSLQGATALNLYSLQFQNTRFEFKDLAVDGYGLQVREPQITGETVGLLDWSAYRLKLDDITLTSSSVAARGASLECHVAADGMRISGDVAYRADVNRVSPWIGLGRERGSVQWFGSAEGTARFAPVVGALAGTISAKITDLAAASLQAGPPAGGNSPWQVHWQEPLAQLNVRMAIGTDWNRVQIDEAQIQSRALQLSGRGTIADLADQVELDLSGKWLPNWEAISAIARGYTGQSMELRSSPREEIFRIQGPLWATDTGSTAWVNPKLVAQASASWDEGRVLGLTVGPAALEANLKDSVVQLGGQRIQVGPGKVHVNPILDLRTDPQLIWTHGPVVESVELTPEICRGWMKFVAPLLAEATRARGTFSLALDGAQVPLSNPSAARASGQLIIDQASIEPGPLGQQLIQLANIVKQVVDGKSLAALLQATPETTPAMNSSWVQMPAQQVGFKLEQQQLIHTGMTMEVRGVTVKTRGAIGLDGQLNMVAEIPILESWTQKQPALAAMRGRSLQIPIGGTLSQPRLDQRALAQWTGQLFQNAAGAQLESRLNSLLNEAFEKNSSSAPNPGGSVPAQPAGASTPLQPIGDALQQSVEQNLLQGIDRLFGPKK